ncbi:peptidoglycan-binding protein [Streptomyces sp. NPDC088194]|uniref:peptidoglycan-binding domain-containing protein n=1 Tax=Streptomyces sp. NPDC088194 TaxID=3154931 RepID=UPI00344D99D6
MAPEQPNGQDGRDDRPDPSYRPYAYAQGDRAARGDGMTEDRIGGGGADGVPTAADGTGPTSPGPAAEDDAGGIRAAERSAQRAAAVAAVEGFHPLRLRPYVTDPHGDAAGESTVRRLIDTDPPGPVDDDGPAVADLGLFPARYAGVEYAEAPHDGGRDAAHAHAVAAARGRHRRRKRGIVVAAAAVAASALAAGAVAVSGQIGQEQGSTDRALPDQSSSMPDVVLPTDATQSTASSAPAMADPGAPRATTTTTRAASPSATPSTSATTPPATDSATPAGSGGTSAHVAGSTSAAPGTPAAPSDPATSSGTDTSTPPASDASSAATQVLQLGDSGPAVADLQRRLSEVWVYAGPINGVFNSQTRLAVATFQVWYWVTDAADGSHDGVYGPKTRAALERQTQGDS